MRYIISIILITTIWSCRQNEKPYISEKFVVKKYSIPGLNKIRTVIFFKDHYYCLASNKRFICLNNKFDLDSTITNSINNIDFDYAFLLGDSLIAVTYNNGEFSQDYYLNKEVKWQLSKSKHSPQLFYEDDKYLAYECCVGEYGGALFFTNKQTKRVYSCPATCARNINKFDGSYYVTISLTHLEGSTKILKIDDPSKLYELTVDSMKTYCNWWTQLTSEKGHNNGGKYSKFEIGTKKILDTIGVLTMTSFVYNNNLYHINTDRRNRTFISKIQGDSLLLIDSIFNQSLWSYNPENRKFGSMQLHSFNNHETSGFLTIKNDTISIIIFENTKEKNNKS